MTTNDSGMTFCYVIKKGLGQANAVTVYIRFNTSAMPHCWFQNSPSQREGGGRVYRWKSWNALKKKPNLIWEENRISTQTKRLEQADAFREAAIGIEELLLRCTEDVKKTPDLTGLHNPDTLSHSGLLGRQPAVSVLFIHLSSCPPSRTID